MAFCAVVCDRGVEKAQKILGAATLSDLVSSRTIRLPPVRTKSRRRASVFGGGASTGAMTNIASISGLRKSWSNVYATRGTSPSR